MAHVSRATAQVWCNPGTDCHRQLPYAAANRHGRHQCRTGVRRRSLRAPSLNSAVWTFQLRLTQTPQGALKQSCPASWLGPMLSIGFVSSTGIVNSNGSLLYAGLLQCPPSPHRNRSTLRHWRTVPVSMLTLFMAVARSGMQEHRNRLCSIAECRPSNSKLIQVSGGLSWTEAGIVPCAVYNMPFPLDCNWDQRTSVPTIVRGTLRKLKP